MKAEPTEESFLRDVAKHEMTVIHDAGEIRHLRFGRPGDSNMHFNLTTVPGYLMFTGDMGAWSFTRLRDMFEFFRGEEDGPLRINRSYWSQKLIAASCNGSFDGGAKEFSGPLFRSALWLDALRLVRRAKEDGATPEERADLLDGLRDVRRSEYDGEHAAVQAAMEFEHRIGNRKYCLDEFYENNLRTYTYHFTWACYAIAWAIRVYDASKTVAEAA